MISQQNCLKKFLFLFKFLPSKRQPIHNSKFPSDLKLADVTPSYKEKLKEGQ